MGQIYVSSLGISGFWVFRVPEFNTRITRINFGYRGLLPEILIRFSEFGFFGYGFGFFGYGFRVSGNMPSHRLGCPGHLLSKEVGTPCPKTVRLGFWTCFDPFETESAL